MTSQGYRQDRTMHRSTIKALEGSLSMILVITSEYNNQYYFIQIVLYMYWYPQALSTVEKTCRRRFFVKQQVRFLFKNVIPVTKTYIYPR